MRMLRALAFWTAASWLLAAPGPVAAKKARKGKKGGGKSEKKPAAPNLEMGKVLMQDLDRDGDGFMSEDEFEDIGEGAGRATDRIRRFMDKIGFEGLDKNGDGKVDTEEAGALWTMLMPDDGLLGEL